MLASGRAVTAVCHRLKKTDARSAGTASSADGTGWSHKPVCERPQQLDEATTAKALAAAGADLLAAGVSSSRGQSWPACYAQSSSSTAAPLVASARMPSVSPTAGKKADTRGQRKVHRSLLRPGRRGSRAWMRGMPVSTGKCQHRKMHEMRPRFKRIVECADRELEQVLMAVVGGFDVDRAQMSEGESKAPAIPVAADRS